MHVLELIETAKNRFAEHGGRFELKGRFQPASVDVKPAGVAYTVHIDPRSGGGFDIDVTADTHARRNLNDPWPVRPIIVSDW